MKIKLINLNVNLIEKNYIIKIRKYKTKIKTSIIIRFKNTLIK